MTYESPVETDDSTELETFADVVNTVYEWCDENDVPHPKISHNGGFGFDASWEINGDVKGTRALDSEIERYGRDGIEEILEAAKNQLDLDDAYNPGP